MAKQENADHAGYLYNSEVLHLRWDLIKLPPGIHCLLTRLFSMWQRAPCVHLTFQNNPAKPKFTTSLNIADKGSGIMALTVLT